MSSQLNRKKMFDITKPLLKVFNHYLFHIILDLCHTFFIHTFILIHGWTQSDHLAVLYLTQSQHLIKSSKPKLKLGSPDFEVYLFYSLYIFFFCVQIKEEEKKKLQYFQLSKTAEMTVMLTVNRNIGTPTICKVYSVPVLVYG